MIYKGCGKGSKKPTLASLRALPPWPRIDGVPTQEDHLGRLPAPARAQQQDVVSASGWEPGLEEAASKVVLNIMAKSWTWVCNGTAN